MAVIKPIVVTNTAIFGKWQQDSIRELRTYTNGQPTVDTLRVFVPPIVTMTLTNQGIYRPTTTDTTATSESVADGRYTYNDNKLFLFQAGRAVRDTVLQLTPDRLVLFNNDKGTDPQITQTLFYSRAR